MILFMAYVFQLKERCVKIKIKFLKIGTFNVTIIHFYNVKKRMSSTFTKDTCTLGCFLSGNASRRLAKERMGLSFPGMERPFPGMRLPSPGMELLFPGMKRPFPGMRLPFPGMKRPFPGMRPPFPGMKAPFQGMKRLLRDGKHPLAKRRKGHDLLSIKNTFDTPSYLCL
jgi:hypothetical protein